MSDLLSHFRVPLLDMGSTINQELAGILIPEPEIGRDKIGITTQFLEDAANYHERYANLAYFKALLAEAFRHIGDVPQDADILDVGSGSGNSVFPCLELLERSRIVATDLSPDLLRMLRAALNRAGIGSNRALVVCMDASRDYFQPGSFQLVVGAAILHHLIDPMAAIHAAAKALAPGGSAIFFEPFEAGNSILRIAYTEIVRHPSGAALDPTVVDLLKRLVYDYQVRTGTDKSAEMFRQIDEKWLFTRAFLEDCAKAAEVRALVIYPLHGMARPFSAQTETNLRLGANLTPEALPRWAWEILDYYDHLFSDELKRDLLIEGCVILRK